MLLSVKIYSNCCLCGVHSRKLEVRNSSVNTALKIRDEEREMSLKLGRFETGKLKMSSSKFPQAVAILCNHPFIILKNSYSRGALKAQRGSLVIVVHHMQLFPHTGSRELQTALSLWTTDHHCLKLWIFKVHH